LVLRVADVQAELGMFPKAVDCGVCRVTTGLRRLNLPRFPTQHQVTCARDCSAPTHICRSAPIVLHTAPFAYLVRHARNCSANPKVDDRAPHNPSSTGQSFIHFFLRRVRLVLSLACNRSSTLEIAVPYQIELYQKQGLHTYVVLC